MSATHLLLVLVVIAVSFKQSFAGENTVIACEGQSLTIQCDAGYELKILEASYGRKTKDICPSNLSSNTNCHAAVSDRIVSQRCQGKTSCTLKAENGVFGDPCVGVIKYLKIRYICEQAVPKKCDSTYRCLDGSCLNQFDLCNGITDCPHGDDENGCGYLSEYACEGYTMHLNCKKGEVISIVNAFYGRTSTKICQHNLMGDVNCRAVLSTREIKNKCNSRRSCEIRATNAEFGDPCVGTYKYVQVNYECAKVAACTAHEFQCDDGHCIPLTNQCNGQKDCPYGEDEEGCQYSVDFACEHSDLRIKCGVNETMAILGASYGRQKKQLCTYQENNSCHANLSYKTVKERCHGKTECVVGARNSEFGDPCPGVIKYLSVNYVCVPMDNRNYNISDIFVRMRLGPVPAN